MMPDKNGEFMKAPWMPPECTCVCDKHGNPTRDQRRLQFVEKFGDKLAHDLWEQANWDAITSPPRKISKLRRWAERHITRLKFAQHWYGYSFSYWKKMGLAWYVKTLIKTRGKALYRKYRIYFGTPYEVVPVNRLSGTRLCHTPKGGSHRKGWYRSRRENSCPNCHGPL